MTTHETQNLSINRSDSNDEIVRRRIEFSSPKTNKEKETLDVSGGEKMKIGLPLNILEEKIPKLGMEFESEESAYRFYNAYAKETGFSVRKHTVHYDLERRVTDRTFVCSCQGRRSADKRDCLTKSHRPETRSDCHAKMKVDIRITGKFMVVDFVSDHNGHGLVSPSKSHFLNSHRAITPAQASQAEDIESVGITPKAGFSLIAKQVGGKENVGFIYQDYKNYLRTKRMREMKTDDTGGVLEYVRQKQMKDPHFFYAIQVDKDGLITNIIWVDGRMKADYAHFGDAVSFDTTYKKNKEGWPFAMFVGANHHKQTVIFGAALLYDETAATYMWLFDTFAEAMNGKKPKTILTDQDAAMAKALTIKWPETCHRLCIWHIYQNAAHHLGSVFESFRSFSKDFRSCIFDHEDEEEFIHAWKKLLEDYGLQENEWMERLFNIKEKWALVYGRQSFCADMISTQRSESMNGTLKRYVTYKHDLLRFFNHFDRLLEDRRYEELKADVRTSQHTHVASFRVEILKHAASVYTYEVFKLVEEELQASYDSQAEFCGDIEGTSEYKVISFGKKYQHTVRYISSQNTISCSCKKFEFAGILCSHALKILSWRNILRIPENTIIKRWTKIAKQNIVDSQFSTESAELSGSGSEVDLKKMIGVQYRELCNLNNQLATRASMTEETFMIVRNGLLKLIGEVDMCLESRKSEEPGRKCRLNNDDSAPQEIEHEESEKDKHASEDMVIKGMKKKEKKPRSGKRAMSGLEKSRPRKKQKQKNISASNGETIHTHGELNAQIHNFNNEGNTSRTSIFVEQNLSHSLPQLSQGYTKTISSMSYPIEGSSLPFSGPPQYIEVVNPYLNHQQNCSNFISREGQQSGMSLTQLLQNQSIHLQGLQQLSVLEVQGKEASGNIDSL